MAPTRLPISALLSRFRILRSGFLPRIHEPVNPRNPGGPQQLTVFGTVVRAGQILFASHIFVKYCYSVQGTEGVSMVPTIPHSYGTYPMVVVSKFYYSRGRNIQVGDIVLFTHPIEPQTYGAKRIVGMPGDYVCVVSPGKTDDDVEDGDIVKSEVREEMIQVPEGHCWVIGDNMEWSRDSRLFGPLPLGLIKGKVIAVWLPWFRWTRFSNPLVNAKDRESRTIVIH